MFLCDWKDAAREQPEQTKWRARLFDLLLDADLVGVTALLLAAVVSAQVEAGIATVGVTWATNAQRINVKGEKNQSKPIH